MKYGDVTKANHPFWMADKPGEIEFVNDSDRTVAATGAHNCFNRIIVKHLLEILNSFLVRAAENEIFFSHGIPHSYRETPIAHLLYGRLNFGQRDISSRTGYSDDIPGFQIPGYG